MSQNSSTLINELNKLIEMYGYKQVFDHLKIVGETTEDDLYNTFNHQISELLLDISNSYILHDDKESFLNYILSRTMKMFDEINHGSFLLIDDKGLSNFVAAYGFNLDKLSKVKIHYKDTFLYDFTQGRCDHSVMVNDTRNRVRVNKENKELEIVVKEGNAGIKSTLCGPIVINGELVGIISFDSMSYNGFKQDDLLVVDYLCKHLSVFLKNFLVYEQTVQSSKYDKLTGLFNRGHFDKQFVQTHIRAMESKGNYAYALLDLNDLKLINDQYGHLAGDKLLSEFAKELMRDLGHNIVARNGGDEFAILKPHATKEVFEAELRQFHKRLEGQIINFEEHQMKVSFSYGVAEYPLDATIGRDRKSVV